MHPLSRRIIRRTPAPLRRPVAVAIRTVDAAIADRLPGLAAEVAFWVVLSLPALLLATIAAAGLVVGADEQFKEQLVDRLGEVASVALTPATISGVLDPIVRQLFDNATAGVISFAFIAALWTASRAVKTVLTTIAIVSSREHLRKGWHDRLLGLAVTVGALIIGTILAPLLIAGPNFGESLSRWLADEVGADIAFVAGLWSTLYWPVVIVVATVALGVLYQIGVPGRSRWRGAWPGAVLATSVWLAGSGGLRIYGLAISDGGSVYGPLAGPIVVLLWLWLTGFAVLLGAELNAQLARVWPAIRDVPDRRGLSRRPAPTTDELHLNAPADVGAAPEPTAVLDSRTDGTTAGDEHHGQEDADATEVMRPITDPAGPPPQRP